MFKKSLKMAALGLIGLAALSTTAIAASSGETLLTTVELGGTGKVWVKTVKAEINPAGCTSSGIYVIDATNPIKKEFLALLLVAQANGNKVNIGVNDITCVENKFPKLSTVKLI